MALCVDETLDDSLIVSFRKEPTMSSSSQLRVAVDVGCHDHRVAIGDGASHAVARLSHRSNERL